MKALIRIVLYPAAALLLPGCYGLDLTHSAAAEDAGGDPALEADGSEEPQDDPLTEPDSPPPPASCPERILPVPCDSLPPECPEDYFPASDGACWTGACLHCIDGCQDSDECMPVQYCGCGYHTGCGWAETIYRYALETDPCIQPAHGACPGACQDVFSCPPECTGESNYRCCGWCDPPDGAVCVDGVCTGTIDFPCD